MPGAALSRYGNISGFTGVGDKLLPHAGMAAHAENAGFFMLCLPYRHPLTGCDMRRQPWARCVLQPKQRQSLRHCYHGPLSAPALRVL